MPQPSDPNTALARLTQAERVQQIADRASLASLARINEDAQGESRLREQQVRDPEETPDEVDEELRRKNPYAGRRRRHGDNDDGRKRRSPHPRYIDPEQHQLDIEI